MDKLKRLNRVHCQAQIPVKNERIDQDKTPGDDRRPLGMMSVSRSEKQDTQTDPNNFYNNQVP